MLHMCLRQTNGRACSRALPDASPKPPTADRRVHAALPRAAGRSSSKGGVWASPRQPIHAAPVAAVQRRPRGGAVRSAGLVLANRPAAVTCLCPISACRRRRRLITAVMPGTVVGCSCCGSASCGLLPPASSRQRIVGEEQQRLFGGNGGSPLLQGDELGFDVHSLTGAVLQVLAAVGGREWLLDGGSCCVQATFCPPRCRSMGNGGERPLAGQLATAGGVSADWMTSWAWMVCSSGRRRAGGGRGAAVVLFMLRRVSPSVHCTLPFHSQPSSRILMQTGSSSDASMGHISAGSQSRAASRHCCTNPCLAGCCSDCSAAASRCSRSVAAPMCCQAALSSSSGTTAGRDSTAAAAVPAHRVSSAATRPVCTAAAVELDAMHAASWRAFVGMAHACRQGRR